MPPRYDGQQTENGYFDTEPAPMFGSFKEMQKFMQTQFSPSPKPKEIKHVVLDADDTIWEIEPWGLASIATPIGHTEEDTLPVRLNIDELTGIPEYWIEFIPTGSVKLTPKLRDTLDKLEQRGIPVSIASSNDKKMIEKYLDAFGLRDKFIDVEAAFSKSKDQMVKSIAKRHNLDSEKILFVDDDPQNALAVSLNTKATSLVVGYNIHALDDILEFIK